MSCNQCAEQSSQVISSRSQTNAIFDRQDKGKPSFLKTPLGHTMVRRMGNYPKATTSYGLNRAGILHCQSCGRFVSRNGAGHLCPNTVTMDAMSRAIARRTKFDPIAAFGHDYVKHLWNEATKNGVISMTHPVTGEVIDFSLDALALAVALGYKSAAHWKAGKTYLAQNGDGKVFEVIAPPQSLGLTPYAPGGPVAEAGAAYGHVQTAAVVGPVPVPVLGKVNSGSLARPQRGTGTGYDMGRLAGSEFRKALSTKGGLRGTIIPGTNYHYGERYQGSKHSSSFRNSGKYPASQAIVAGRTFVRAAYLLASGEREGVLTNNGMTVELYAVSNGKRGELRAVFDASGSVWVAGDTDGSSNLSEEQAAAMAYWMAYSSQSHLGAGNELRRDLIDAAGGNCSLLAASDSIYIGVQMRGQGTGKNEIAEFGAVLQAPRCPDCGQWAGSAHVCPVSNKQQSAPLAPDAAPSQPEPETKNKKTKAKPSAGDTKAATRGRKPRPKPAEIRRPPTVQEIILQDVIVPAPDRTLRAVPQEWGGQRSHDIRQEVPAVNSHFVVDEVNEPVLASVSSSLQVAAQLGDNRHAFKFRAFGLAGPPSAGKNELIRQVAASLKWQDEDGRTQQGLGYTEATITDKSTVDEVIGGVVMEDTGTGTRTRVALGPVGMALASGSVVAVNEIVRNPKLATAFQSIMEDGVITINSPESGTITIPVHPASALFMTWNPGYEGDADRPALAALSRMTTFRMQQPGDDVVDHRVASFFNDLVSDADEEAGLLAPSVTLRESYKVLPLQELQPTQEEIRVARQFWRQIQAATGANGTETQRIGFNSLNPPSPQIRDLYRFVMLGKTIGWKDASRMFQICCDQDEDFDSQWATVESLFAQNFGNDGQALNRARD